MVRVENEEYVEGRKERTLTPLYYKVDGGGGPVLYATYYVCIVCIFTLTNMRCVKITLKACPHIQHYSQLYMHHTGYII